jgi:formyltetrahydrofolate-dependent phosphoribosylglycinamide formyltransferase
LTRIAVFASGRGSNFQAIYKKVQEGYLNCHIDVLICDNAKAGALEFADQNKISTYVVKINEFPTPDAFGEKLIGILTEHQIDYILLAGYLKKIPDTVIDHFENRILNIHPALLPAFGGKGMYGSHVHQAVYDSGAQVSGVTVHFVNKVYDEGPILLQKAVDIRECHSPESITEKVLAMEHQVYSQAVKILLEKNIKIQGKRVIIND